jgi:hypothetical protein
MQEPLALVALVPAVVLLWLALRLVGYYLEGRR